MEEDVFAQEGYRCRLDWGRRGARAAAARGDVLVIVDVLSFSTTAATAIAHGGILYPCADGEDAAALAASVGAEVAVRRAEVPRKGRFSLSPLTFVGIEPGTRVVVRSPNGATCSRYGRAVPYLFVGALVNARAVGEAVNRTLTVTRGGVTVIACGERWQTPGEDGDLRFAVEDYLGAGAILASLDADKSPEARLCEGAFRGSESDAANLLWDCASGRELRAQGCEGDVRHAARRDLYKAVPVLRGGALIPRGGAKDTLSG